VGADIRAQYVWFQCAEGYSNTIDMPTALHPQTQLSFKFDGEILPRKYGFPMKCRMPTKLGFKNPKHVIGMDVTNKDLGGYWEDQGYNWHSGVCGFDPECERAPRFQSSRRAPDSAAGRASSHRAANRSRARGHGR